MFAKRGSSGCSEARRPDIASKSSSDSSHFSPTAAIAAPVVMSGWCSREVKSGWLEVGRRLTVGWRAVFLVLQQSNKWQKNDLLQNRGDTLTLKTQQFFIETQQTKASTLRSKHHNKPWHSKQRLHIENKHRTIQKHQRHNKNTYSKTNQNKPIYQKEGMEQTFPLSKLKQKKQTTPQTKESHGIFSSVRHWWWWHREISTRTRWS